MFIANTIISTKLNESEKKTLTDALDLIDSFFFSAEIAGARRDADFTNLETGETFSVAELDRVCGILHGLLDTETWIVH